MGATPQCPRCGYDQTGLVETWRTECPLEGVCSECGLEFDWAGRFAPRLNGPAWSFEHGDMPSVRRFRRTIVRSLRPGHLFKELSIDHTVVVSRLLLFMFALFICTHFIAVAMHAAASVAPALISTDAKWPIALCDPYTPRFHVNNYSTLLSMPLLLFYTPALILPWTTLLLRQSLVKISARPTLMLRGGALLLASATIYSGVFIVYHFVDLYFDSSKTSVPLFKPLGVALVLGYPAWMTWFWSRFLVCHLRLAQARSTAFLLVLVCFLCTFAVIGSIAMFFE